VSGCRISASPSGRKAAFKIVVGRRPRFVTLIPIMAGTSTERVVSRARVSSVGGSQAHRSETGEPNARQGNRGFPRAPPLARVYPLPQSLAARCVFPAAALSNAVRVRHEPGVTDERAGNTEKAGESAGQPRRHAWGPHPRAGAGESVPGPPL
jgi:hypothetical protein